MEDIYEYLNYRQFLSEYYAMRKEKSSHFSLRSFGRMIDLDASYLAKIFNGTRHLAPRSIPILSAYFKFNEDQCNYFEQLVYFNKARSEKLQREHFQKLLLLRKQYTKNVEGYQFSFYQKWYYTALRNILEFYPFTENSDFHKLGQQLSPPITAKQAEEGVHLLKRLHLIKPDNSGVFKLTDKAISSGETWNAIAVSDFQREAIRLCSDAVDNHPKDKRDISTVTMNITNEEFKLIRSMIKEFRSSVIGVANSSTEPNQVFQLNIQMIPLSKDNSEEGNQQ